MDPLIDGLLNDDDDVFEETLARLQAIRSARIMRTYSNEDSVSSFPVGLRRFSSPVAYVTKFASS